MGDIAVGVDDGLLLVVEWHRVYTQTREARRAQLMIPTAIMHLGPCFTPVFLVRVHLVTRHLCSVATALIKKNSMKATKNRHNLRPERANKSHITHSGGHRVCRRREEDDALRREYTKQYGSKYSIALLHNHVLLLLVVVACR